MTTTEFNILASEISEWNWEMFFKAAKKLGKQFNDRTWRFLKAEALAISMQTASNYSAEYKDDLGYDLIMNGTRIEVKTQETAFCKNLDTRSLRIKNTMGDKQSFPSTFDYLIIASTEPPYQAAMTTWEFVNLNKKFTKDAITAKIPKKHLLFLTETDGMKLSQTSSESYELKDNIRDTISKWVEKIE